jgi:hypothetical protein
MTQEHPITPPTTMKESLRACRFVELKNYNIDRKGDDFLEVTEWTNGEGFDMHLSRGEQSLSMTWEEFTALQQALGDWIDQPNSTCPHIVSSDEGTSYCKLAEKTADLLAKLRD